MVDGRNRMVCFAWCVTLAAFSRGARVALGVLSVPFGVIRTLREVLLVLVLVVANVE